MLLDEIVVLLGGRVAEQIFFSDVTNGAVDDLNKVTKLARAMVMQYGMSPKMGPMAFGQRHEMIFLGREIGEQRNYSEHVAREIDKEVNRIVTEAYDRAKEIVTRLGDLHHAIARKLIQVETLDAEMFESFFAGIPGVPPRKADPEAQSENAPNRGASNPSGQRSSGTPSTSPSPA